MRALTDKQRETLAKHLLDTSRLILTALVLGSFLSGRPFNSLAFIIGLGIFIILSIIAVKLMP